MTIYQELVDLKQQVAQLEGKVSRCSHEFNYGKPKTTEINVPTYDHWAGWGYTSEKRYGMRQESVCNKCGLTQFKESLSPGEKALWKNQ